MMTLRCIRCGKPIAGIAQLCDECELKEQEASIFLPGQVAPVPDELQRSPQAQTSPSRCPSCGQYVPVGAGYCVMCGKEMGPGARIYAGFWIRLVAWMIDTVLLGTLELVMLVLIEDTFASLGVQVAFSFVYVVGFWVAEGATPGKIVLGIRLEMIDGRPITASAALVRYVGYFASALTLLGFLLIGFTRDKRGLHDYLAGTVAITNR